jgi:hypothetical protein
MKWVRKLHGFSLGTNRRDYHTGIERNWPRVVRPSAFVKLDDSDGLDLSETVGFDGEPEDLIEVRISAKLQSKLLRTNLRIAQIQRTRVAELWGAFVETERDPANPEDELQPVVLDD